MNRTSTSSRAEIVQAQQSLASFDYLDRANTKLPEAILRTLQNFERVRLHVVSKISANELFLEVGNPREMGQCAARFAWEDDHDAVPSKQKLILLTEGTDGRMSGRQYFSFKDGRRFDPTPEQGQDYGLQIRFRE